MFREIASEKTLIGALLVGVVVGVGVGWFSFPFLFPLLDASGTAAWVQAIASVAAILWAGRQGRALFEHQRQTRQRAAVELAVGVVRTLHAHLVKIGEAKWWPEKRLKAVVTGKSHFRIDYLEPIERMLDQVNLEHLSGSPAVDVMIKIRSKIWRIKELLIWIVENKEAVRIREMGGERIFARQARYIKSEVDEIYMYFNELITHMNKFDSTPVTDS